MKDRNGDTFTGTPEELKRWNETLRKRAYRAKQPQCDELRLPLPEGTRLALERVMAAAGFDDARDFLAFQIHRLDALRDSPEFEAQAVRTVRVTGLEKWVEQVGAYRDADSLE